MVDTGDKRIDFLADYVLTTLKLKADKWMKCIGVEENKTLIVEFLEKADHQILVIVANAAGLLTPSYDFPDATKTKVIYFIKKGKDNVSGDIKTQLMYGDLSYAPLDQLSSFVDEVNFVEISFFFAEICISSRLYHVTSTEYYQ